MTEDVPVRRSSNKKGRPDVYHTDPDCRNYPDTAIPATDTDIEEMDECSTCSGEFQASTKQDWSYQNALKKAAGQ